MERKPYEQRFDELYQEFQTWEPAYKDLSKYIDPERGRFTGMKPNIGTSIDHKILLDETPTLASRTFASGMQAGITSPGRPWIKIGAPDPDLEEFDSVRMWLDAVQQKLFTIMSKSNIYEMFRANYEELGVFNTAAGIIDEDFRDVIRCKSFTAGEYYLGAGPDGRINTLARAVWYNVSQLIKKFGYDNVSPTVKTYYDTNKRQQWIECRHMIEPNEKAVFGQKDSKNMPYTSVYWEKGSPQDTFLRISGYQEFPINVLRSDVIGSNVYGTNGPGRLALGSAKELQQAKKQLSLSREKLANPPVQRSSTVDMINALPGGVSTYGGSEQQLIKPLYQITNPYIQEQIQAIQDIREMINSCFYVDLFLMISQSPDPSKTAFEIAKRYEEKLMQLSPLLEIVFTELKLIVERVYSIAERAGLFPPPPRELQGQELKIEFISALAQAQKMIQIAPLEQVAGFVGNLIESYPEVRDKFDAEEAVDQYASMVGVTPKVIRSDEKISQIRKKRDDAAQKQAMLQNTLQIAQGAKTLSETDTGGNNALTAILGGPDAIINNGGG